MDTRTKEQAARIYNALVWWDIDESTTPESIAEDIETRPGDVIELLIKLLEA